MDTPHPEIICPVDHAEWRADRMGKATLYESPHLLVGLNAFEPGQSHELHTHRGMDKVYHVLEGEGTLLLENTRLPLRQGDLTVAPAGVPHGIHASGRGRLLLLALLAPGPASHR